jgi:alpha-tubulin suppressor-like RCC1 family protein
MASNNALNFDLGTSGQVLTSNGSGSAPTMQDAPSGALTWEKVTDATKTMEENYSYGADLSSGVEFTLPSTCAVGEVIEVVGVSGTWIIEANPSQTINFKGALGGSLGAYSEGDVVKLRCTDTDNEFTVISYIGDVNFYNVANLTAGDRDGSILVQKYNGELWSWGNNNYGQLGNLSTTNTSSPIQVIGGHSFVQISSCLTNFIGLKSDGSAWTWGLNNLGQLGDGTTTNRSSPVQVIGGHSFVQLGLEGRGSRALKADGSAWAWGDNDRGQLGDGTTTNRSSPVQVIGGHSFVKICSGDGSVFLKSDGSAWTCGNNNVGQLGDGTKTNRSSPVQVIGNHSFIDITAGIGHFAGLKSDGSAWTCGNNVFGQLGDGTTTNRSSPVQVIGNHSFVQLGSTSGDEMVDIVFTSMFGVKINGSAWTWGINAQGQLGDGTTTNRTSPVQVIGDFFITKILSNHKAMTAITNNRKLIAWGFNDKGQLGDGTITDRSSPVYVLGFGA